MEKRTNNYDFTKYCPVNQKITMLKYIPPTEDASEKYHAYMFEQFIKNCPSTVQKILCDGKMEYTIATEDIAVTKFKEITEKINSMTKEFNTKEEKYNEEDKKVVDEMINSSASIEKIDDYKLRKEESKKARQNTFENEIDTFYKRSYFELSRDIELKSKVVWTKNFHYLYTKISQFHDINKEALAKHFAEMYPTEPAFPLVIPLGTYKDLDSAKDKFSNFKEIGDVTILPSFEPCTVGIVYNTEFRDEKLSKLVKDFDKKRMETEKELEHRRNVLAEKSRREGKNKVKTYEKINNIRKDERIEIDNPLKNEKDEVIDKFADLYNPRDLNEMDIRERLSNQTENTMSIIREHVKLMRETGQSDLIGTDILRLCEYSNEEIKAIAKERVEHLKKRNQEFQDEKLRDALERKDNGEIKFFEQAPIIKDPMFKSV